MDGKAYGAGITIHALEGTSVFFVLSNEVKHTVYFHDSSAMSLHMFIRARWGDGCSWHLSFLSSVDFLISIEFNN